MIEETFIASTTYPKICFNEIQKSHYLLKKYGVGKVL
jgi:hypothetical protein